MQAQEPKLCLMVDDDADDQEIFSIALNEIPARIDCVFANNGIEALQKLNSDADFTPDFIFLDLNMPCMNGKQCLIELVKIKRLSDTPIIIYSTSPAHNFQNDLKKIGATDYFTKPTSVADLVKELKRFLHY